MNMAVKQLALAGLLLCLHAALEQGAQASDAQEFQDLIQGRLESGASIDAVDQTGNTLLHHAVSKRLIDIAQQLIDRGADVNAVDVAGWTPLHVAVDAGCCNEARQRASKQLAELLVRNGADVNAATEVYGWTALHMAAAQSGLEAVSFLIEHGADIGARSRIGGFTPLAVTAWRVECSHPQGSDAGEVAMALGAKGANATAGPEANAETNAGATRPPFQASLGSYGLGACIPRPSVIHGAFTAAGAIERLAFVGDDILLVDKERKVQEIVRPSGGTIELVELNKLCLDLESKTHSLVFRASLEGNSTPNEAIYLHYDRTAGVFSQVFSKEELDDEWRGFLEDSDEPWRRGPWSHCTWREEGRLAAAVQDAVDALRVDQSDPADADWAHGFAHDALNGPAKEVLTTRVVPTALVEEHLANIRLRLSNLPAMERDGYEEPSIPTIKEYFGESSRWRVVVIEDGRLYGRCGGLMLIWDGEKELWRTVYDCADIRQVVVHQNKLHGLLADDECDISRMSQFCYFEADLLTWQIRWWGDSYASDWQWYRKRPESSGYASPLAH